MSQWALQIDRLSKSFLVPRAADDPDPRREHAGRRDRFFALRGVSLTIAPGQTVGLVGPNGSGKSTLLKILAGVMQPSSGSFTARGRVGALLELGAGFHPDLTGIDNIYLNGALLGLPRREVDRLLPEIIAFSELEQFMDTPVRHFSSGMTTRLGFAVATQLAPDLLLMDETFAAGDARFQAKALAHIAAMKAQGRTIVLVSHNMEILLQLADRVVWLDRGAVRREGPTREVLAEYRRGAPQSLEQTDRMRSGLGIQAVFEDVAPDANAAVRIASASLSVEGEPDPRYATPPEAKDEGGRMKDEEFIHPSSFILHPFEEPLAIRMGQTLRVDLVLAHPGVHPDRAALEAAWVRDDDRILAQSRTPLELGTGLPATRCALRFGPWELTEGEWRLVLGVSPQVADRAPGASWRHYDRLEVSQVVRVVTPNPQELRVAMPIPCRWEV